MSQTSSSNQSKESTNINIPQVNIQEKLDPAADIPPEEILKLAQQVDFSKKSPELLKQEEELRLAAAERQQGLAVSNDLIKLFSSVYFMTYKGQGPVEHVLFQSTKVPPLIIRDCQVWCNHRNVKYLGYRKAYIDINKLSTQAADGPPIGDITNLVTRQSHLEVPKQGE